MNTRLLSLVAVLGPFVCAAQPQQASYVITDVLEICYCSDGSGNGAEFLFTPSIPGETVTLMFCSGNMLPENVIRTFTGPTLDGPIPGLTGSFSNLTGVTGTSDAGSGIFIEFDEQPSPTNCANGDHEPFRFFAFIPPGELTDPSPEPDDCIGTTEGIGCSLTDVGALTGTMEFAAAVVDDRIRIEQRGGRDANVGVELSDLNGRKILSTSVRMRTGQRIELPMPDMATGTYVLTCTNEHQVFTQRVTIVR